jgi:molybdopterin synthase catalytic subunit
MKTNQVKILFFATYKHLVGLADTKLSITPGCTVREFRKIICDKFPILCNSIDSALIAVNQNYSFSEEMIPDEAEVAIFPPVSGGNGPTDQQKKEILTVLLIQKEEIDHNLILKKISLPTTGAACFFSGIVRGITTRDDLRQTDYLEYEAYEPMALRMMQQIVDEISERWNSIEGIAIIQRIGRLDPGTTTVVIACTAGHRDTGIFEAARYGIDRLKEIVPVWKKEVGPEGESWVEGTFHP